MTNDPYLTVEPYKTPAGWRWRARTSANGNVVARSRVKAYENRTDAETMAKELFPFARFEEIAKES